MGKKLLIIGNGFDLAHGLPTKYSDFLEFARHFIRIAKPFLEEDQTETRAYLLGWKGNEKVKDYLVELYKSRRVESINNDGGEHCNQVSFDSDIVNKLASNLNDNIWMNYFIAVYDQKVIRGNGWIDFEAEISRIIQWLDREIDNLDEMFVTVLGRINKGIDEREDMFINILSSDKGTEITTADFLERLYDDLERFAEAFDIYLSELVENIAISPLPYIEEIKPDYVISFNYTHTYQRAYNREIPICYIHGECKRGLDDCNIVFGIDEYLDINDRNSNTTMAIFKKFIQRIRKKNSTSYKIWNSELYHIHEMEENRRKLSMDFRSDSQDIT